MEAIQRRSPSSALEAAQTVLSVSAHVRPNDRLRSRTSRHSLICLAALLASCGAPAETIDGSTRDAAPARDARPDDDATSEADAGAPSLGVVTSIGTCDAGPIAGTTCERAMVSCPDSVPLGVSVRVSRPTGTPRATLVLGTGGGGQSFFEDASPRSLAFVEELVSAGAVVVRRYWDDPGWVAGSAGVLASSCRYATLLAWLDENVRAPSAPYCALGLSGGAIEIAYALSRWSMGARLSGAILLGGPSMSRLDVVCPSVAPEPWVATECSALAARHGVDCGGTLYCTLQGAAAVVDSAWMPEMPCSVGGSATALEADGSLRAGSRLSFAGTRIRVVLGADECAVTPLLFYDAIDSDRALAFPPATPHDVMATDAGVAAARDAVREACGL